MRYIFVESLTNGNNVDSSPLLGIRRYSGLGLGLGRQAHLTCPECRADVSVPCEGFPVCRLSESIRENIERAQQSAPIPVKQQPKKSKLWRNQIKLSMVRYCAAIYLGNIHRGF